jgi:hypothetical protein
MTNKGLAQCRFRKLSYFDIQKSLPGGPKRTLAKDQRLFGRRVSARDGPLCQATNSAYSHPIVNDRASSGDEPASEENPHAD